MGFSLFLLMLVLCTHVQAERQTEQNLRKEMFQLKASLAALTTSVKKRSKDVAYEVRLGHDVSYNDGEVFKFNDVVYNAGGGYNKGSGIFIAPISGTYLLWAHIMRNNKHWMDVNIHSNKGRLLTGYITSGSYAYGVASITGVAYLKKGDHVWVSKYTHGRTSLRGYSHSSYGGALLKAH